MFSVTKFTSIHLGGLAEPGVLGGLRPSCAESPLTSVRLNDLSVQYILGACTKLEEHGFEGRQDSLCEENMQTRVRMPRADGSVDVGACVRGGAGRRVE